MSKHLRALREAGLVEVRPEAQHRDYRIRPEPLAEVDDWLAQYRWLWTRSLDRLEAHLAPGATITFPFGPEPDALTLKGEVLEANEPESLAFTWGTETLRFTLTSEGEGTLLVLIDELQPGIAARNAAGWDDCLNLLTGAGKPDKDAWKVRFAHYTALFAPTLGEQEGPPAGMG